MEEKIITFTANEQGLVKTGGISHYASDTISYIKAVFTLGENWNGFDEVRAVFKSPYKCKNAVLDSNGECYVPVEVLFYKGKVRVNLVGSIVTETEVTDRLTTYSVEALDVDEDVPICGEESQPISPSEYEQFVAKVANDANRASQSATGAKTYADEAEASAQNASESASASAVSASDSARSATASAESAQNASEIAVEVEVMKNEVELAKDKVLGMRATAETLEAGSDATASYSDGLLTLGIPRGDRGEQGIQGETGATPNLTIGTVETLAPTEDATASITGTAENPVLNLGLPKGDTGEVSRAELDNAVTDVKSDLSKLGLAYGEILTPSEQNNNWALNGSGLAVSNTLAVSDKFAVSEGDELYLNLSQDTTGTYQWQNTAYVPSAGTNNGLIGSPVNGNVDAFVTVPAGATYLIVSRLKTNTTNVVRYGSNTALKVKSDVADLKNQIVSSVNIDIPSQPIMINMMPYMWANGYGELATPITSDATAETYYYVVSGTEGSDTLTIESGSTLTISDMPEDRPNKAILVNGSDYSLVSVINIDNELKVYPKLSASISNAYLYAQGVSIHLTKQGYVRYTRDFYGAKSKYCDKSRYIAMYDAWDYDNVPNPLTKIGSFNMGKGVRLVGQSGRRVVENASQTYLQLYFANSGTVSNTIGAEWEVDLNYTAGYVEVLIGASDSVDLLNAELPEGVSINIDLYLDDELSKRYTKTDKRVESVCLDFGKAKKGKLRITTNSGANAFAANVSHIAWYVTNKSAEDSAINPYGAMSMLMDSWGVYCDNAVQTEYARLVGLDANGMAVPLTNHSVGGQTSAWGCSRFYADAWADHPKYVLIDFGINDVNQGITQDQYCRNMKALIDSALANDIIPVVLMVGWATTGGLYYKYTLPLISYCAEDVSVDL